MTTKHYSMSGMLSAGKSLTSWRSLVEITRVQVCGFFLLRMWHWIMVCRILDIGVKTSNILFAILEKGSRMYTQRSWYSSHRTHRRVQEILHVKFGPRKRTRRPHWYWSTLDSRSACSHPPEISETRLRPPSTSELHRLSLGSTI